MPAAPLRAGHGGSHQGRRTSTGKLTASISTLTLRIVRCEPRGIRGHGLLLDHGVRTVRLGQGERQPLPGIPVHGALLQPSGTDPDRAQGARGRAAPKMRTFLMPPHHSGPGRQMGRPPEDPQWRRAPRANVLAITTGARSARARFRFPNEEDGISLASLPHCHANGTSVCWTVPELVQRRPMGRRDPAAGA